MSTRQKATIVLCVGLVINAIVYVKTGIVLGAPWERIVLFCVTTCLIVAALLHNSDIRK